MIDVIKPVFRKLGLRRYKFEDWHYRFDCYFPTRFLDVWLLKPSLFLHWLQNTAVRRTMLCFPDQPDDIGYEIRKLAMILGVRLTREAQRPDLAIAWQDTTVRTFDIESVERKSGYLINSRCPDIGKDRVQEVFERIFGYPLKLDPTTYQGLCVRKSIANAEHDGAVIECPIASSEPGYVYQRLVNNYADSEHIVDLRAVFYCDTIPLVLLKYRPIKTRFHNRNAWAEISTAEKVFSSQELKLILAFASELNLDFCNLDILRDNDSQKIYIVDVNTTPFGPTKELSPRDKRRALAILASAFHEKFIAGFPQLVRERKASAST